MENLSDGLLWSRCCDVAARVYRLLTAWNDRTFADRVLVNILSIPERLAARMAADSHSARAEHAQATIEALTVLQTQLYLACECGLLTRDESSGLCFEAAALVERLLNRPAAATEDRDG